ncbi:MAG: hypothetical protein COT18_04990 [Elusimicrobia bacterium CG08_land_8_20_14_0_20_59_10]|nr:MAG: hypothetical protein COT18_04990 [Elusimicrobia bacterium CG08_land_8_20_14_0_20_59_10]
MNPVNLLLLLSVLSGAGGVACEVLYLRSLTTFLGDMYYVHAALVAVFLLGLGLGAWAAHRFASRLHIFELAAGAYAFAFPALTRAYEASPLAALLPHPGAQAVLASALLLAVPAVAAGFAVPLFAAYLQRQGKGNSPLHLAYGLYNIGAAAGLLLMEFAAVRYFGVVISLRLLGALSLACGLLLWLRPGLREAEPEPPGAPAPALRQGTALFLASLGGALFSAFFLKVGYCIFLPSRENFAVCTAATLFSITAGTWLVRRRKTGFADCALLSAFGIGAVYAAFPLLEKFYYGLLGGVSSEAAAVSLKLFFAFLLGGLPVLWFWGAIPALVGSSPRLARDSGRLLLVSGLGNAAGLLLYTFLIHPRFELFTAPAIGAALLVLAAIVYEGPGFVPRRLLILCAAALLCWRVAGLPQGLVYAAKSKHEPGAAMIHFKSASDNVTYVRGRKHSSIIHNGVGGIQFGTSDNANISETVFGVLPALAAPRKERALVLGLGTGITAGTVAALFGHTDIVEINGACLPLLPVISGANLYLSRNPRASIFHDDGRRFLARPRPPYDAIVSTLPPPDYAAAAKLHTLEFYDLVKRALAPDGVYLLWFTYLDMSDAGVETILATLSRSFRHCGLVLARANYYVLICSNSEVKLRSAAAAWLPREVQKAVEAGTSGADPFMHLNNILLTGDIFPRPALAAVTPNRDDLPLLEFQITAARYKKEPPVDQVVMSPGAYNIRLRRLEDPRFLEQALVISYTHPVLFQRSVLPVLARRPALLLRFLDRLEARFGRKWGSDNWLQMALLAAQAKDLGRAQRYCEVAVSRDPLNFKAVMMLARLYAARGDQKKAGLWRMRARVLGS